MEHIVIPPGQEAEAIRGLVGPTYDLEPVCPMCGHMGAGRLEEHRVTKERTVTPCFLSWCGAHGVLAPYRYDAERPRFEMVPNPDGCGHTGARRSVGVKCDACGYVSHASAFCTPTGPPSKERPET